MMKFSFVILLLLLTFAIDGLLFRISYGDSRLDEILEFDGEYTLTLKGQELDTYEILVKNKVEKKWYSFENKHIYLTEAGSTYLFLMKHTTGGSYEIIDKMKVLVENSAEKYIYPDQDIQSEDPRIISLGKKITKGTTNQEEKARNFYHWVIDNTSYDHKKYDEHQNNNFDHLYGALVTLESSKGVCYDYATLYAALARSQGIPTKIVEGYYILDDGKKEFHAWNQVYVNGKWMNIDTTLADTLEEDFFEFEYQNKYIEIHEY